MRRTTLLTVAFVAFWATSSLAAAIPIIQKGAELGWHGIQATAPDGFVWMKVLPCASGMSDPGHPRFDRAVLVASSRKSRWNEVVTIREPSSNAGSMDERADRREEALKVDRSVEKLRRSEVTIAGTEGVLFSYYEHSIGGAVKVREVLFDVEDEVYEIELRQPWSGDGWAYEDGAEAVLKSIRPIVPPVTCIPFRRLEDSSDSDACR